MTGRSTCTLTVPASGDYAPAQGLRTGARFPCTPEDDTSMRIALVPEHFLPHIGGIERHVAGLAHKLMAEGHSVRVITTTPGPREVEGIPVHRFRVPRVPVVEVPFTPLGILALEEHIRKEEYDLLHIHHSVVSPGAACAAFLGKELGLPVVVTFHSIQDGYGEAYRLLDRLASWTRWPVIFSAVSPAVARGLQPLIPDRDIRILPNGVEASFWDPTPAHPQPGALRIVATLRLAPRKRPAALLEVTVRVLERLAGETDVTLRIIGDGPDGEALRRRARDSGLEGVVTFSGELPQTAIREIYRASDVFLHATVEESFGLAALEARCAGLPVVARRGPGVSQFLEEGRNGLLADTDQELAEHLVRLARDPELREAIARENRATTPSQAWSSVLPEHFRIYAEAVSLVREEAAS